MTTESSSEPSPGPAFEIPPREGLVSRIFLSRDGLRVGWSLVLYAALFLAIGYALDILAGMVGGLAINPRSPQFVALGDLLSFASAYAGALVMAKLERRSAGVYGLPLGQAFGRSFWQGILLGLGEVSLLIGLVAAFGGYSFGTLALGGTGLFLWAGLWGLAFLFVGLSEEFLFRGYAQFTLARGIGFWRAALCLSLVFGAAHLKNPGEGLVGAANVAVTGLVFAFALRRTGNLWLAVGWHAAFDFGETFLFSVPDSGFVFDRHLSNAVLEGPVWLTGGAVGPEGSVFGFLTMGISALAIHFLFPANKHAPPKPDPLSDQL